MGVLSQATCKLTSSDASWPNTADWQALNDTLDGSLIATRPAASSCYDGNPFNSSFSCNLVEANWTQSAFHASLPESVDYPIFANNSCLPPGASGYNETLLGCHIGGLPIFVVNTTSAEHIATALAWASARHIRIVVKGTGHDLNGRSAGAYALSIWTHSLKSIKYERQWQLPAGGMDDVFIVGSGVNWGEVTAAAAAEGRVCISGQDSTVGLGGFIQAGGHGPLSSHYGLSADNIYQATVVTTSGEILVANDAQNQDLIWAIRGGGPGLYGVVTEYVLRSHPIPETVVAATLSMHLSTNSTSYNATWAGLAAFMKGLPDSMDAGLTGNGNAISSTTGVTLTMSYFGYNMTAENITSLLEPVSAAISAQSATGDLNVTITEPVLYPSYMDFFNYLQAAGSGAGAASLVSSRVLGRADLSDLSICRLQYHLQRVMRAETAGSGSRLVIGLQGGLGPAGVETSMRGALNPAWRTGYVHSIVTGSNLDLTIPPQDALSAAATWTEEVKEAAWREWAPTAGAYINEANPYTSSWKQDFYGENYDRLLELKMKYDPTGSLYVLSGVNSDAWDYNLTTGKLCRVA
ncbi:hypothetical protein BKA67DRAFT_528851 [Truncatella angustata]|uniref:FAD-binding PCMH-type domain-containing protein n=1 Tax=Truncatella angustata TaxID=152316 RepID=A0A9P8RHS1_9PEZI|nr:uncharacterized protein BKA67DRAFT_528851 [Truncatella angustata]KAH6638598.1 hypothetical protein BKA67DRAFT_528851 [Truncatella angustata]